MSVVNISSSLRRVVVTGMGLVSPLGVGVDHTWRRLINGESGLVAITEQNYPEIHKFELTSRVVGSLPIGDKVGDWDVDKWIPRSQQATMSPFIQYAMSATEQALTDSGWKPTNDEDRMRTGICFGSGIGSVEEPYTAGVALHTKGKRYVSAYSIPRLLVNLAAGHISIAYGLQGPNHAVSTACTTGAHSIGDAYQFIQLGHADVMVAGGTEQGITPISVSLFSRCRALSTHFNDTPTEASRPFSKSRDGFVIADGAGAVILEEYEHAKRRGAKIYAEVRGYGLSGDAYHITQPSEDGRGAYNCMRSAVSRSGLPLDSIGYVNAHATSTPIGDRIEVGAIQKLFGDHYSPLSVSSTKGAVGHLLGAAGSVEAIFSILALKYGILPPTLNLGANGNANDVEFQGNFVPLKAQEKSLKAVMTNSFGFGGTNASLVFAKCD